MNRTLLAFFLLLGGGIYLSALAWTGLEYASYTTTRPKLFLEKFVPRHAAVDETLTFDLSGGGFDADTHVSIHMDVNNQDAIVGSFPLDGVIYDMEVSDKVLYVAGNGPGIRIFDVRAPDQPKMLPSSPLPNNTVIDIERHGSTLYLSCGTHGLKVAQINDHGNLHKWQTLYTWSPAIASKVVDHFLYVAAGSGGLLTYDLNNLEKSQPIAVVESDQRILGVEAFGNFLYAVAGSSGVLIYKIGPTGMPVLTGQLPAVKSVKSITIADKFLYVLENGRLSQYDLVDPLNPAPVIERQHFSFPRKLFHAGNKIYVTDNASGLGMIDNSHRVLPEANDFLHLGGDPRALSVVGGFLYVAIAKWGIKIIDPLEILPQQLVQSINTPSSVNDFILAGDSIYLSDRWAGSYLKKLGDPPDGLKQIGSSQSKSFALTDNYLFAVNKLFGVEVFDTTAPAAPEPVASWPELKGHVVAVDKDIMLLGRYPGGLVLVDIADFDHPEITDEVSGNKAFDILITNNLAFVAGELDGVRIYRINNGKLVEISQVKLPFPLDRFSGALQIQSVAGRLFIANGEGGLLIVDIQNPEKPEILNTVSLPGVVNGLHIVANRAYVTSRRSGLHIFDISDLRSPRQVDLIEISDLYGRPHIYDDLLYLGNKYSGVIAIPVPQELEKTELLSSGKIRVTIPPPKYPGRYSIQVRNRESFDILHGVLRYHQVKN